MRNTITILNYLLNIKKNNSGFTLFEMLLAVSVFAIIGVISAPVYIGFKTRNDVDSAATITASALRRASVLSQSMQNDSSWGVLATTSEIIIFSGGSYALRNPIYDESKNIVSSIQISGKSELVFAKFTGMPISTGTLIFTSLSGETRNVSINEKNVISY